MDKKAIIYCRVATMSKNQSQSLELQKKRCVHFALQHGYKIVDVVFEQGGGTKINKQLKGVINRIKGNEAKKVIISSIDRLGRDYLLVATLIKEIEDNFGEVKCANEPESAIEARFVRNITLGIVDYYKNLSSECIKKGFAKLK